MRAKHMEWMDAVDEFSDTPRASAKIRGGGLDQKSAR